jgi:hypothetical protein
MMPAWPPLPHALLACSYKVGIVVWKEDVEVVLM